MNRLLEVAKAVATTQVHSGLKDPKDIQPLIEYLARY